MSPTLAEIRAAQSAIRGRVARTPCTRSRTLSEITGAEVVLKFENLQFTASFKERGALTKLLSLNAEERSRGVVAMSAGNHAQAVAYHSRALGIHAVIVMPRFTPSPKVDNTRSFGAEVILHGEGLEEAGGEARRLAHERGLSFVHPYDDERVIAGQGTLALEMLEDAPELETLLVPIGGGGLIAGVASAAKALRPDIEVIGVETARFPSMLQAWRGEPIRCGADTLAEGIAVKAPGKLTLDIVRERVDEIVLVEEDQLERAVLLLLDVEKTVVEGAGAAGLAALLGRPERFRGRRVGLVLSGGNIDLWVLSSIIQRGLERGRRLVRLRVLVRDVPGALAEATRIIGEANGNIIQVHHQRAFVRTPLQSAEVEFVLQTRGRDHADEVVSALRSAGYPVDPAGADDKS